MKNNISASTTRRAFLKKSLAILPVVAVAIRGGDVFAQDAAAKALDEKNPTATTLGYVHDAKLTDTVKFPKRKGPEGEKQFCSNCILLTQSGLKVPGAEGDWGKCAIFTDGLVNANGWCNSWAPKG